MLTLPEKMSIENKLQRVEDTIQLLELDDCKHTSNHMSYVFILAYHKKKCVQSKEDNGLDKKICDYLNHSAQ